MRNIHVSLSSQPSRLRDSLPCQIGLPAAALYFKLPPTANLTPVASSRPVAGLEPDGPARRLRELQAGGQFSLAALAFMQACVRGRQSLLFTGRTGAGKTTLLNACVQECLPTASGIVCEDTSEVNLPHAGFRAFQTSYEQSMADVLAWAVRQSPDYLVLNECRDSSAAVLLQAGSQGQTGLLVDAYATEAQAAVQRLVYLAGLAQPERYSESDRAAQVALSFHYILHVGVIRQSDGRLARKLLSITELRGRTGGQLNNQDIFRYDPARGEARLTGARPHWLAELEQAGFNFERDVTGRETA